jgi:hypothetical protein
MRSGRRKSHPHFYYLFLAVSKEVARDQKNENMNELVGQAMGM